MAAPALAGEPGERARDVLRYAVRMASSSRFWACKRIEENGHCTIFVSNEKIKKFFDRVVFALPGAMNFSREELLLADMARSNIKVGNFYDMFHAIQTAGPLAMNISAPSSTSA